MRRPTGKTGPRAPHNPPPPTTLHVVAPRSALVIVGNVKGNHGLTTGMPGVASAGDGLQAMVMGSLPPITNLVIAISSGTIAPMLVSLNSTIQAAVDVPGSVAALHCVNSTLWSLPNVSRVGEYAAAPA